MFVVCVLLRVLGYIKISQTRWLKHYSDSQIMSLRLYGNSRRMMQVIEEHYGAKFRRSSQQWRDFYKSMDFVLHLINTGDYLVNISNPVNMIVQKAKYRFNGQFSFFYLREISATVQMVDNLHEIMYFIDEWTLLQFKRDFSIKAWTESNPKLFQNMAILKANFQDLLYYKYKGYILSNFDMNLIDDEYKEVTEEVDSDSESEDDWS